MDTEKNYIVEIKAFYDWLETNPIATSSIALWHALMAVANKTRWKSEFSVAISVLAIKTGLKKDAIENARNVLAQKGRIEFKSRGGNQSAVYKIIPFAEFKPSQDTAQPTAQDAPQDTAQPPSQDAAINKQNKTKQNNKKKDNKENFELVSSEAKKEVDDLVQQFEELYAIYPKKQGKEEALRCFIDDVRMGVDRAEIKQGVMNYVNHCKQEKTKQQYILMISTFFREKRWTDDWTISDAQESKVFHEIEHIPDGNEIVDGIFKELLEKGLPLPETDGPF